MFNVLSLALYNDCKYEYELRKIIYSYVEHKQEYFKRYLTEDNIDDYIKEMRRATTSGGEIELIALSELYKINLPIWDLLTQEEPKIKVMNPLANKNVLLYIEGKDHYNLLIPKNKLEEFSTYKRLKDKDYKETNESSIIYQSRIDNEFKHDKESVFSKKFLEWAFNYIKTGTYPEKLLKDFTNKSALKQRKNI